MSGMWASLAVVLTVTIGVGRAVPAAMEALVAQGPAPGSPASGAATVDQEIRAALAAYWRAIETQDLETYRRLRPDLAPAELEKVRRGLRDGAAASGNRPGLHREDRRVRRPSRGPVSVGGAMEGRPPRLCHPAAAHAGQLGHQRAALTRLDASA